MSEHESPQKGGRFLHIDCLKVMRLEHDEIDSMLESLVDKWSERRDVAVTGTYEHACFG